eukprot:6173667-Pleurochrysis_carterae.AAC.3
MESNVSALGVSRTLEVFVGVLMHTLSDPNDINRARFLQLHQAATSHREARTYTVFIVDTGPRSHPDQTNPAQITWSDVRAARVDCVLS